MVAAVLWIGSLLFEVTYFGDSASVDYREGCISFHFGGAPEHRNSRILNNFAWPMFSTGAGTGWEEDIWGRWMVYGPRTTLSWRVISETWHYPRRLGLYWPDLSLSARERYVGIPFWTLFVAGALARAATLERRPKTGCARCGYDLAGNASGVCPECGTVSEDHPSLTLRARRERHPLSRGIVPPMITRLAGMLESVEGMEATVRMEGGLWRQVLVPAYLAEHLGTQLGKPVTLHTLEYLESQGQGSSYIPRLIGFGSPQERRFFELLTGVDGFGNRKALRALAHQPAAIARAILGADAAWLTGLPEIGKKTAEKVILELKGKVSGFLTADEVRGLDAAASGGFEPVGPAAEAVAALVALGETRPDAERRVRMAMARDAKLASADQLVAAALGS